MLTIHEVELILRKFLIQEVTVRYKKEKMLCLIREKSPTVNTLIIINAALSIRLKDEPDAITTLREQFYKEFEEDLLLIFDKITPRSNKMKVFKPDELCRVIAGLINRECIPKKSTPQLAALLADHFHFEKWSKRTIQNRIYAYVDSKPDKNKNINND